MLFLNNIFCEFNWEIFAIVTTAISTFGLLVLGIFSFIYIIKQLRQTRKITEADIIIRINKNFFTEKTIKLFYLMENKLLIYKKIENKEKDIDYDYFEIDKEKIKNYPNFQEYLDSKKILFYTSGDLEHLILNNFEDLGIMKKNKMLQGEIIKQNFRYYIITTCNNPAINQYLKKIKKDNAYPSVVELYNEFKSYDHLDL